MKASISHDDATLDALAQAALEEGGTVDLGATSEADRAALAFEIAAAEAELALGPAEYEPMPASIRHRLDAMAEEFEAGSLKQTSPVAKIEAGRVVATGGQPLPVWTGWVAAAAVLVLSLVLWPSSQTAEAITVASLAEQRQQLIDAGASVAPWGDWALEGEGPEIAGVTGDVVWDEASETGYMRFTDLPALENAVYQLWIVDERGLFMPDGRSARISGGVFTAESGQRLENGDLIVPITPRLDVRNAGAFAVTIEDPGGVWTSDMSRRAVIAVNG